MYVILFTASLYSQIPINFKKNFVLLHKENLHSYTKVYKIKDTISVEEVDRLIANKNLELVESKSIHPISENYFWIKFTINWSKADTEKIVELDNPHLNHVVLYIKEGKSFKKIGYGGDKAYRFYERSYINRRYIFPLKNTKQNSTYYFFIENYKASMSFPLWIWEKHIFESSEKKQNVFFTLFFSFVFLTGFFSICIGVFNKKWVFIHYGSYVWSLWVYLFTTMGFSFQYLYPEKLSITSDTRMLSLALLTVTCINFVISFLEMKKNTPRTVNILRAYQFFFVGLFLVYLYDYNILYAIPKVLNNLFTVNYILVIFCFALGWQKAIKTNKKNARLFAFSFSFVAFGILLYMGLEAGILPHSWFIINPMIIGVGLEVIALTLAMMLILKRLLKSNNLLKVEKEKLKDNEIYLNNKNNILKQELGELQSTLEKQKVILEKNTIETLKLKSKAIIKLNEITHISSDGNYLEFYFYQKRRPEVDRDTLKRIKENLPQNFIQIHRSFIINVEYLKSIHANKVMLINGIELPVSRSYKNNLSFV